MKRVLAILIFSIVLIGTVSREVYASKLAKTNIASTSPDQDDKDGEKDKEDRSDLLEKNPSELIPLYQQLCLGSLSTFAFYSFFIHLDGDFPDPYLDCISLPPEQLS